MHLRPGLLAGLVILSAGFAFNCGGEEAEEPRGNSGGKGGTAGASAGTAGRGGSAGSSGKAGSGGSAGAERECTPGLTQSCLGPGACTGAQVCRSDGSGWGVCDCGGESSGGAAGEAGSGGASDRGGAGGAAAGEAGEAGEAGAAGAGGQPSVGCDPIAQSGCDDEEKCSVVYGADTSSFECVAAGTVAAGAPCTLTDGLDDCAPGHHCAGPLGADLATATCRPLCETGGTSSCEVCVSYDGFPSEAVGVCHATCNPLAQDCEGLLSCIYTGETQPVCARISQSSAVPPGGSCRFVNECTVGSSCLLRDPDSASGGRLCSFHCDATGGGPSCGELDDSDEYACAPITTVVEGGIPSNMGVCMRCADYPGFASCPVLQPGGCDEHTDCSPLEDELGLEFVCNLTTSTCVLDLP